MTEDLVATVRRFNRTVTQRVGALDDEYLSRGRPLGQARLLWEIGPAGAEVAALRARLGLDAGYLSRLLRALESDGLVVVAAGTGGDARVREVTLTAAGRAEWTLLDRGSDDLAQSILGPLSTGQRTRLATAMAEVERLLMASMVELAPCPPGDPRARACLRAYARELAHRFDDGFDTTVSAPVDDDDLVPPRGVFLLATLSGEPVGCGALKLHRDAPAEIKRLWVSGTVRGLGVGRRILTDLEHRAAEAGHRSVRLDTNRNLVEAIRLYRSSGYVEVPRYNDEAYAHHWFEKALTPVSSPAPGSPGH
ncbi:MarR family transcriptional regulator [Dactylosporangium aurantiacum]|uniref:MarR family transcriptional regulator n=1 Tax=Dactylosporangium aurantiacum TaxID=35754 RepID=A0A9Q9IK80_9ACTN|nr:helix-turn-helix domain-containing GNAT family N-acetyltransferase [Dactylosporangium aurantiacum]MDG6105566.1 helix-turn-helix domain-containing GNAT family N-acetyltransferase [Dactylosporangium aurantiacum]UWZ57091.1 MarR family transcriptional regulator [Dactylosporangium aurantiacum]